MATPKIITLQYDPDQLRRMFDSVRGDTASFGARLAGLMLNGASALDAIPLAMYGIVHLSTLDVPGEESREAPLRAA